MIVFDNDNIGRGIQVDLTSKHELHLALSLPATENDVRMLYKLACRIASLWKAKHMEYFLYNVLVYVSWMQPHVV